MFPIEEISVTPAYLRMAADDNLGSLTDEILHASTLYKRITQFFPDIIGYCVNTATAHSYQNTYKRYEEICLDESIFRHRRKRGFVF